MNIPDEYAIPIIGGIFTIISGASAWVIAQHKQYIEGLGDRLNSVETKLELHNLTIHEYHTKRQSDYEILSQLRLQMEKLTDKLQEVHLELQTKQTRS